ncbi:MAG: hypothetical protein K9G46_15030 [Flavobacteriales bacterium]|nr:hypothetical protein [Flavobacteriales bacterium]
MKRTLRSEIGEVTMRETGMVFVRAFHNTDIDLEQAKSYHSLVELLTESEPHVTVMDISGLKHISKEARDFLTEQSSKWGKTVAVAFITTSFTARTIASFFLTINKPTYPIKVFKDPIAAHQWAKNEYYKYSTKMAS